MMVILQMMTAAIAHVALNVATGKSMALRLSSVTDSNSPDATTGVR